MLPRNLLLAVFLAGAVASTPAVEPRVQSEIGHLLDFISAFPCVFIRNATSGPRQTRAPISSAIWLKEERARFRDKGLASRNP